ASLPRLVGAALAHGVPADRPVAIVERGHRPSQRTVRGRLSDIVRIAQADRVENPAVIVFGDVARADLLLPVSETLVESTA
ncbi:MAG TPA: uroporphyrinogen-III C-methyltransferase, partial [Microbacterium sp.]|nr:uroporphyrinogen-III C-methyltransferase [Microbacterium sp.]